MKLYEIDEAIMACIDAETGEIIDADKLDKLTMERDAKIENVKISIKIERGKDNEEDHGG